MMVWMKIKEWWCQLKENKNGVNEKKSKCESVNGKKMWWWERKEKWMWWYEWKEKKYRMWCCVNEKSECCAVLKKCECDGVNKKRMNKKVMWMKKKN